jgi:hypothetical protein
MADWHFTQAIRFAATAIELAGAREAFLSVLIRGHIGRGAADLAWAAVQPVDLATASS